MASTSSTASLVPPTTATSNGKGKGKVTLTGAQETVLLTLLARAVDAASARPILNDVHALAGRRYIESLGYEFGRASFGDPIGIAQRAVAIRGRVFDAWTEDFLSRHGDAPLTVLHLACGLDARCLRVKWQAPNRLWVDVDRADVNALRRQMGLDMPPPPRGSKGDMSTCEYRLIDPNITEPGWLERTDIPRDRPVLVLMEGLTMYLTAEENHALLRQVTGYFQKGGEVRFDTCGSLALWLMNAVPWATPLSIMGARMTWALDNPHHLEPHVPGLRFKDKIDGARWMEMSGVPFWLRIIVRLAFYLVYVGRLGGMYGYKF